MYTKQIQFILQMVLNGTMEVYAPYANFSFYSTTDQLAMISQHMPSFVLTKQPSYLLASTTFWLLFNRVWTVEKLVTEIYKKVNDPLSLRLLIQMDKQKSFR